MKWSGGVAGVMSECGGDVRGAGEAVQADRDVPQGGHDLRPGAGLDLGGVLGEGDVADPVQAVLDLPVPPDPGGQFGGPGLVRAQVGDRVDGLGAPPGAVQWSAFSGHLDGQRRPGKPDPGADRSHLD
ncbi:MAG: hypothetical protein ACRDQ0_10800, partial [Pseudonocardia sp.]